MIGGRRNVAPIPRGNLNPLFINNNNSASFGDQAILPLVVRMSSAFTFKDKLFVENFAVLIVAGMHAAKRSRSVFHFNALLVL